MMGGFGRGEWGSAYPLLELGEVGRAKSIGLGNNGDEVDAGAEPLHHLDIQGLEGVSGGSDEVQAGMYTEIDLVLAARLLLLKHVRLMLVVEKLDNGHPRVAVVHVVTEAGGVDDGKAH